MPPGQDYLLFSSDRVGQLGDGDLYVSFRSEGGDWLPAKNLGKAVNSRFHEAAPTVSPDGRYLFLCSFRYESELHSGRRFNFREFDQMLSSPGNGRGDIFWVDARVIEEAR